MHAQCPVRYKTVRLNDRDIFVSQPDPPARSAALAMTRPQEQIIAKDIAPLRLAALFKPIDAFYGFWVNGSAVLLARAIGSDFVDHTLPPGRPQGPSGPGQASKGFPHRRARPRGGRSAAACS
jgi:hypothetical protein